MADVTLKSYQQILGQMVAKFLAETDITDLSPGSVFLTIMEAAASSDFTQEGKLLQLLNIRNPDKAKGVDLENLASEMGVTPPRLGATSARVTLTVSETAFTKVSTTIFAGAVSPAAGDDTLKITDATTFNASGTIYVGRGTPTSESIPYVSLTNTGSYWIANLASALTKDHLVGEEVTMAQGGDREIPAGTIARVPATAGNPAIEFSTLIDAVLLDGEDTITDIDATAVTPGLNGNVGINKIKEFASNPWSTASVTNLIPADVGGDAETDTELRQRIKDHVHNLGKGTERAIIQAVLNVSDPDEQKVVVSAFLREPTVAGQLGILFIDDGTGFAPSFSGVGEEVIVTSAAGTEQFLQLQQFQVVKAQVVSIGSEPFALSGGERFRVEVDGQAEERSLPNTDYRTPGVVMAQEVAETINKIFTTVEARAKDGRLFITPAADDPDYIRIGVASGTNANATIRFPIRKQFTIRLYKNDKLLEKNGSAAIIQSFPNIQWTPFSGSESLQLKIDGISSPVVTVTNADFSALTTSTTILGASVSDWAIVINAKFIGVTATAEDDGTFIIQSNRGASDEASISVMGGSLAGNLISATATSTGKGSEFKLNRLLGQIELADKLLVGDELKAGTVNTAGFVVTTTSSAFDLSATLGTPAKMVILTDVSSTTDVVADVLGAVTFTVTDSITQRMTGATGQFSAVIIDDWIYLYNLTVAGLYRIKNVANDGSYVEFFSPSPTTGSDTPDDVTKQFVVFRTAGLPQEITLPVGANIVSSAIVASINAQLSGGIATELDNGNVEIATLRLDGTGSLSIPVLAGTASNLGFDPGDYPSNDPHIAAIESGDLAGLPSGRITIATPDNVAPYDDILASGTPFTQDNHNRPVLTYIGAQQKTIREPLEKVSSSHLTLREDPPLQTVGIGLDMKATTTSGCEFGQTDNMVFIIDDDAAKKTFDIPMYVDATIANPSVPSSTQFDAADASGSLLGSDVRWQGMRFEDYRVWFKARADIPTVTANAAIRIQANQFGNNGKNVSFGIFYPSVPASAAIASFNTIASTNDILISLTLGSGVERAIGVLPGQTITVSFTGPVSGLYTYQILFDDAVDLTGVLVGDIVTLNDPAFNVLNRGQFAVTSISTTPGSVYVRGHRATAGANEAITAASSLAARIMQLDSSQNSAANLISDVNNTAGVKDIVTASNSGSSTGAGIVVNSTEIELSNGNTNVPLQNGESFVLSAQNASPAITLKAPMDVTPEIGEAIRLVPMTPENIKDHFSRKQISGLSIAANINIVNGARHVQVASKTPGGGGQVYAVGGKASGNNVLAIRNSGLAISGSVGQVELDHSSIDLLNPGHTIFMYQPGRAKKNFVGSTPISSTTVQIETVSATTARITLGVALSSVYSYTHTGSVKWIVRQLSRGRIRFELLSGTATIPGSLIVDDWVLVGNGSSYKGITPAQVFATANQGFFQVRETDNATYFDVDATGAEQIVTTSAAPFTFLPYHSALPGDQLTIGSDCPVLTVNKGSFIITAVNASTVDYLNSNAVNEGPTALGVSGVDSVRVLDQGYSTYRKVTMVAPSVTHPTSRSIAVIAPGYDISLFSEGQGAKISLPTRLGYVTDPVPGISGYQYWTGLKRRVQRVIDGYEPDTTTFPGVRAAGVAIEVREPQIQRVQLNIKIKTKEGVALASISDSIKSSVVGFINSLGLSQDVILSEIVSIIQSVTGVDSVVLVNPTLDRERITITDKAIARTSPSEITLS